jgi:hypothetical protein
VTAALNVDSTLVVREALEAARHHGAVVSFDCNYRSSLWKARGCRLGSIDVNRELMPLVDVLFGREGDLAATPSEASHGLVWHMLESFEPMAMRVIKAFSNVNVIASSMRRAITANKSGWGAFGFAEGKVDEGLKFEELEILDRVGGGDSFASGFGVCESIEFGTCEQEASDPIDVARGRLEDAGLAVDGLDGAKPAVYIDMANNACPGASYDRQILFAVEDVLIDAISDRVGEESRTGDLRQVVGIGIEQTGAPETVGALDGRHCGGHLTQLLDVLLSHRIIGRHDLKNLDQRTHHPAIAT